MLTLLIPSGPNENVNADSIGQNVDFEFVYNLTIDDVISVTWFVTCADVMIVWLQQVLPDGEQHLDEALNFLEEYRG